MELQTTDVSSEGAPPPSVSAEMVSAPAEQTGSEPQQTAESGAEAVVEQPTEQAEAAFKLPENDDDLKGQENNPHVQAVIQLRQQLRERDQRLDEFKPLTDWKPIVEKIGNPAQAQTAYELTQSLFSSPEGQEYSTLPFLQNADKQRPGVANQLFHDLLTYRVPDENGAEDTLVRHMYRAHSLDPDRIEDYRNIDMLRASGVVTAEDLGKVPEQFREAFKSLSKDGQDDILELIRARDENPQANASFGLRAEEHLRNAQAALEAKTWREKDEQTKREAAEQQQAQFQQQVAQAVEQDIVSESQTMYDSIHKSLSSQVTFSSDATVNSLECDKILSVVANLQSPYPIYRDMAARALKAVGVDVNGFSELASRFEHERGKYVALKAAGQENTWDGQDALSKSETAKQQILVRANDYALKLAKAGGERAATAAAQTGSQLETATARFVPSGTGQAQQGNANPYMNNPHPVGSQEYYKFYRDIDKANGLNNASVFS